MANPRLQSQKNHWWKVVTGEAPRQRRQEGGDQQGV
jgi:hypothetical protein